MNNTQLNTKVLISVSKIISKDNSKIYLENVLVTKNYICATNGHCLCKFECDTNVENNILIPLDIIKIWSRMVPKRFHEVPVIINHINDDTYSLNTGNNSLPFNSVDTKIYLDVERVIPTSFVDSNKNNKNFNWNLVSNMATVFTELSGIKYPKPIFSDAEDINLLVFKDDKTILILMPLAD